MSRMELHQEWERRMDAFRASGQSARAWCAAQDIHLHRFWYWARKLRTQRQTESIEPIQWLTVTMNESQLEPGAQLTVRIGHAYIEVKPGFQPALLTQVVEALSHAQ